MDYEIEGQVININDDDVCCRIRCDLCIGTFLVFLVSFVLFTMGYIIIITFK